MSEPTPLVPLRSLGPGIFGKIEYLHPSGSMKHRAIPGLISELVSTGEITSTTRLVILTAGSAGITLAWAGAQHGIGVEAIVPANCSELVVAKLRWLGAEVHPVSREQAEVLLEQFERRPDAYVVAQTRDRRLLERYKIVADEIIDQLGSVSAITVGIGTGLSATAIAERIAELELGTVVHGVEPEEAAVASGKPWAPHGIAGLAPPMPQPLLDTSLLGSIVALHSDEAWRLARQLARADGLLVGPSSGATAAAAVRLREAGTRGPIVAILASAMHDYLDSPRVTAHDRG